MCTRIAVSFECQFCSPFVSTIFPPDPNHGPRRRAVGRSGGRAVGRSGGRAVGRQRYRVVGGTPFCHPIAALIRWTGCVTDPLGPCGVLHRASSDARHGFVLVAAFSAFSVSSAVAAYDIAAWRRRRTTGRTTV